jgi:hypothetical protein
VGSRKIGLATTLMECLKLLFATFETWPALLESAAGGRQPSLGAALALTVVSSILIKAHNPEAAIGLEPYETLPAKNATPRERQWKWGTHRMFAGFCVSLHTHSPVESSYTKNCCRQRPTRLQYLSLEPFTSGFRVVLGSFEDGVWDGFWVLLDGAPFDGLLSAQRSLAQVLGKHLPVHARRRDSKVRNSPTGSDIAQFV